jgi:hypothetical protein
MKTKIKPYLAFYQSFCFTSILISLLCGFLLFGGGSAFYFSLFLFKIITSGLIFFYMREYKSKEFYFYKNLGISQKALWIFSAIIDFAIFFLIIILVWNIFLK